MIMYPPSSSTISKAQSLPAHRKTKQSQHISTSNSIHHCKQKSEPKPIMTPRYHLLVHALLALSSTLPVISTPMEAEAALSALSKRKVKGHPTDPTCLYTTACGITCWGHPNMDWCHNSMVAVCAAFENATWPMSDYTTFLYITGDGADDGDNANCVAIANVKPDATTKVGMEECLQKFMGWGGAIIRSIRMRMGRWIIRRCV